MQSQNENLDPISISAVLSEFMPIMNFEQATEASEVISLISSLAISKLRAAEKGDKNKYRLLEKQQIEAKQKGIAVLIALEESIRNA